MNDNAKIVSSNVRSSYIKKNIKQDNEIIIYNYNDNKKFNNIAKKINLVNMPIRQKKLLLFEQNKNNISLLNIQEQNKSNEKRRNKFIFSDNKDIYGKISINLKNNKNNNEESSMNKINSGKVQSKQVAYSQRNYKENKIKNNKPINNSKFYNSILKKNNNENAIKEFTYTIKNDDFYLVLKRSNLQLIFRECLCNPILEKNKDEEIFKIYDIDYNLNYIYFYNNKF